MPFKINTSFTSTLAPLAYFRKYILTIPNIYINTYKAFFASKGLFIIIIFANCLILASYLDQNYKYLRLNFYITSYAATTLQLVIFANVYIYKAFGINSYFFKLSAFFSNIILILFSSTIIYYTQEPKTGWWVLHFLFIFIIAQLNYFHINLLLLVTTTPSLISTMFILQQIPHSFYFISYGYGISLVSALLYYYQAKLKQSEDSIQKQNISLLKEINHLALLKEKERISRDLHDSLGASLTANVIYSQIASDTINSDSQKTIDALCKINDLSRDALVQMRNVIHEITDHDNIQLNDFVSYIQNKLTHFLSLRNLNLSFNFNSKDNINALNPSIKFSLNKIITEWFNNIMKHSNASKASLSLNIFDHYIVLDIKDNGMGFDKKHFVKGNGIRNIEFRAQEMNAKINIHTSKNGTSLYINSPIS